MRGRIRIGILRREGGRGLERMDARMTVVMRICLRGMIQVSLITAINSLQNVEGDSYDMSDNIAHMIGCKKVDRKANIQVDHAVFNYLIFFMMLLDTRTDDGLCNGPLT